MKRNIQFAFQSSSVTGPKTHQFYCTPTGSHLRETSLYKLTFILEKYSEKSEDKCTTHSRVETSPIITDGKIGGSYLDAE